jgi:hypothetical protein
MSETMARWRMCLFRSGQILFAVEVGLYVCGVIVVNLSEPLDAKVWRADWLFVIGTAFSLIVLTLSVFGCGPKRIVLSFVGLLSLLFWYGLTWF